MFIYQQKCIDWDFHGSNPSGGFNKEVSKTRWTIWYSKFRQIGCTKWPSQVTERKIQYLNYGEWNKKILIHISMEKNQASTIGENKVWISAKKSNLLHFPAIWVHHISDTRTLTQVFDIKLPSTCGKVGWVPDERYRKKFWRKVIMIMQNLTYVQFMTLRKYQVFSRITVTVDHRMPSPFTIRKLARFLNEVFSLVLSKLGSNFRTKQSCSDCQFRSTRPTTQGKTI